MQEHVRVSLPTRSMQAFTVWRPGGVPQRTKQGFGGGADLTIQTAHLELGYTWQPTHKPLFLRVYLALLTLRDHMLKVIVPCRALTPYSPPKTANHISMAEQVQELLSPVMLGTSSPTLGDSTPKRLITVPLGGSTLNQGRKLTKISNYFTSCVTTVRHAWQHCAKQPFVPHNTSAGNTWGS